MDSSPRPQHFSSYRDGSHLTWDVMHHAWLASSWSTVFPSNASTSDFVQFRMAALHLTAATAQVFIAVNRFLAWSFDFNSSFNLVKKVSVPSLSSFYVECHPVQGFQGTCSHCLLGLSFPHLLVTILSGSEIKQVQAGY